MHWALSVLCVFLIICLLYRDVSSRRAGVFVSFVHSCRSVTGKCMLCVEEQQVTCLLRWQVVPKEQGGLCTIGLCLSLWSHLVPLGPCSSLSNYTVLLGS